MRSNHRLSAVSPPVLRAAGSASVYAYFGLAMVLTVVGVLLGGTVGLPLINSGWIFLLLALELLIIFTSRLWIDSSPLNYVLFPAFPLLSGMTVTPFIVSIFLHYANGAAIILNATVATALLSFAMAILAWTTSVDFGIFARALILSLLGIIAFGVLQIFLPSLRGQGGETFISLVSVLVFSLFLAYDVQRIQRSAAAGTPAMLLALSLYLDIFNLFLSIIRLMAAFGGRRR